MAKRKSLSSHTPANQEEYFDLCNPMDSDYKPCEDAMANMVWKLRTLHQSPRLYKGDNCPLYVDLFHDGIQHGVCTSQASFNHDAVQPWEDADLPTNPEDAKEVHNLRKELTYLMDLGELHTQFTGVVTSLQRHLPHQHLPDLVYKYLGPIEGLPFGLYGSARHSLIDLYYDYAEYLLGCRRINREVKDYPLYPILIDDKGGRLACINAYKNMLNPYRFMAMRWYFWWNHPGTCYNLLRASEGPVTGIPTPFFNDRPSYILNRPINMKQLLKHYTDNLYLEMPRNMISEDLLMILAYMHTTERPTAFDFLGIQSLYRQTGLAGLHKRGRKE